MTGGKKMLQGFSRICLHSHYVWGHLPAGYQKKCHVSSLIVACMQLLSKANFSFPIKVWPHLVQSHPTALQTKDYLHSKTCPYTLFFFDIIICCQHNCRTCWNFKDWCLQRNVLLDCKHSDGAIKPTVHTNTQCERIISTVYTATNPVLSLPLQSIWAPMWLSCGEVGKFFRNV